MFAMGRVMSEISMRNSIIQNPGCTHAIRAWVDRDRNCRGYLTECGRRVRYRVAAEMKPVTCKLCLKVLLAHRGPEFAERAEAEPGFNTAARQKPRKPSLLRRGRRVVAKASW